MLYWNAEGLRSYHHQVKNYLLLPAFPVQALRLAVEGWDRPFFLNPSASDSGLILHFASCIFPFTHRTFSFVSTRRPYYNTKRRRDATDRSVTFKVVALSLLAAHGGEKRKRSESTASSGPLPEPSALTFFPTIPQPFHDIMIDNRLYVKACNFVNFYFKTFLGIFNAKWGF